MERRKAMKTEKSKGVIRRLARYVGEYWKNAVSAPAFTVLCVVLEILIPYLTASMIDEGISVGDMGHVVKTGLVMALFALLAMICGVMSGRQSSRASTGFAYNLRRAMFENIQTFSFSNIDKFSTAGLVTRLTTDVNSVQMSFQMIMMICTRAPVTLAVALFMAFSISARLSLIFLGVMGVLLIAIGIITARG